MTKLMRKLSRATAAGRALPPLTLYIHFPWCVKKCPYCDFNSHPLRGEIAEMDYARALLEDLERDMATYGAARKLSAIFMGGGTPNLFRAATLGWLLTEIRARIACAEDMEITMEANPGAAEQNQFAAYRAAGINRLSLGVQSFNYAHLKILGRIHSAAAAARAIQAARAAGFANLNVDLMHGLPAQTTAESLRDLERALAFAPSHLSLYQLTIEPNTWFARHPPKLPADAKIIKMQQAIQQRAAEYGYARYEISSYARPGMQCRHNLNYWQFGDYLGIGAGAHGKITRADGRAGFAITRYEKPKHPKAFMRELQRAAPRNDESPRRSIGVSRRIRGREALFEMLLNGLRLTDGLAADAVAARAGCSADEMLRLLDDARRRDWIVYARGRIQCTARGYWFVDEILQQVLPPD